MASEKKVSRPLVTVVVLSFNQEKFIANAIDSVLAQDYENLEVVICDDCSTDKTVEIIKDKVDNYEGSHAISYFFAKKNTGVVKNFNFALSKSKGELLVAAAGDDISYENRVSVAVEYYLKYGFSAFYSSADIIGEVGNELGELTLKVDQPYYPPLNGEEAFKSLPFYGAGAIYSRRIFSEFGPVPNNIRNEDYNFFVRSLITDGIAYHQHPLLAYRKHSDNLSYWVKIKNSKNLFRKANLKALSLDNQLSNMAIAKEYFLKVYGSNSRLLESYNDYMFSVSLACFFYYLTAIKLRNPFLKVADLKARMIISGFGRLIGKAFVKAAKSAVFYFPLRMGK